MLNKKAKIFMGIYSVLFLVVSISAVYNNIENEYHFTFIIWSIILYFFANLGNIFYSLGHTSHSIQKYWRVISPLILMHLIVGGIIDQYFGQHSGKSSMFAEIIVWLIVIIIFLPTLWANFILGYKKEKLTSS